MGFASLNPSYRRARVVGWVEARRSRAKPIAPETVMGFAFAQPILQVGTCRRMGLKPGAAGRNPSTGEGKCMLMIDVFNHFMPKAYLDRLSSLIPRHMVLSSFPRLKALWD